MHNFTEPFYKLLMDHVSDMIFSMNVREDGQFVYEYLNQAAIDGVRHQDWVIGKTIQEVNDPQKAAFLNKRYQSVKDKRIAATYQDIYEGAQGEHRYSESTLTPYINDQCECTHVIAIVKDLSTSVYMQKKLEESEELFRIIAESAGDLITLIHHTGEIIYTSPSYRDILGTDPSDYIGKLFLHNIHLDDRDEVYQTLYQSIENHEHFNVRFRQYRNDERLIWSESNGKPVYDADGNFKHIVVVTRDISQQIEYESQLKHFALHDSLTGLPNRRLLEVRLADALHDFSETGDRLAVIMLDIDEFKRINDTMGHGIGDAVIEEFGNRVYASIAKKDTVARLGGDEFVVLLPSVQNVEGAVDVVRNIQQALLEPWDIDGHQPVVTASIGITMVSTDGSVSSEVVLNDADIALYQAKRSGGNTFKMHQQNTRLTKESQRS